MEDYTGTSRPPTVSRKAIPVPQSLSFLWSRLTGGFRHGRLEPAPVSVGGLDTKSTICQFHFGPSPCGIRFGNWEEKVEGTNFTLPELFRKYDEDDAALAVSCLNHESVHWLLFLTEGAEATTLYDKMFWDGVDWKKDSSGTWVGTGGTANAQMWEYVHFDGRDVA